jgi:hypothetical protein
MVYSANLPVLFLSRGDDILGLRKKSIHWLSDGFVGPSSPVRLYYVAKERGVVRARRAVPLSLRGPPVCDLSSRTGILLMPDLRTLTRSIVGARQSADIPTLSPARAPPQTEIDFFSPRK